MQSENVLHNRARELRHEQTPDEQALWRSLRDRRFAGFKFRRQYPIGHYIVDFICLDSRLIVELDGAQHLDNHEYDQNRDAWLVEQGFRVLRFWNNEWRTSADEVLNCIWHQLQQLTPHPPLRGTLSRKGRGEAIGHE